MSSIEAITTDQFESRVLRASGPVFVDLYQATCAPCRALEPRLEVLAQRYSGRVPVYRVDIERDLSIANRLNVKSIPTVLVFSIGKEVQRLDGLITTEQLQSAVERVVTRR